MDEVWAEKQIQGRAYSKLLQENVQKQRGKKLDYYWCPYCNGFHLTSMEVNMKYYGCQEVSDEMVAVS